MKYRILSIITLVFLVGVKAQASEIFGSISTNMGNIKTETNSVVSSGMSHVREIKLVESKVESKFDCTRKNINSGLIRGSDMRIYVIRAGYKEYIPSLLELRKRFLGVKINNVSNGVIGCYPLRSVIIADDTLIRENFIKIYLIRNGRKHHIINLSQLRKYHAGKEILDVSMDVVEMY